MSSIIRRRNADIRISLRSRINRAGQPDPYEEIPSAVPPRDAVPYPRRSRQSNRFRRLNNFLVRLLEIAGIVGVASPPRNGAGFTGNVWSRAWARADTMRASIV